MKQIFYFIIKLRIISCQSLFPWNAIVEIVMPQITWRIFFRM